VTVPAWSGSDHVIHIPNEGLPNGAGGKGGKGIIGSENHQTAVKLTPLGRIGQPDDIGRIAVFLASDESYWLTGQIITAAGGMTI